VRVCHEVASSGPEHESYAGALSHDCEIVAYTEVVYSVEVKEQCRYECAGLESLEVAQPLFQGQQGLTHSSLALALYDPYESLYGPYEASGGF
jgi:hypothetical protein